MIKNIPFEIRTEGQVIKLVIGDVELPLPEDVSLEEIMEGIQQNGAFSWDSQDSMSRFHFLEMNLVNLSDKNPNEVPVISIGIEVKEMTHLPKEDVLQKLREYIS